ncbi:MAG: DUF4143 domain-containing protein [Oscillospiraceae bacterium]|nr:DUF4143 domain-containing protein [Oscillospiraceae bacterium]
MYRILIEKLIEWKEDLHKRPLIVKGVPQCGKTYLLKEFGKKFYKDVLYLDFSEDPHLTDLFNHNLNPEKIIKDLSLFRGSDIKSESTLIIFDSVDSCGQALDSLEHFSTMTPQYHIIAVCSYLEKSLTKVDTLTLYPMNFYEFLHAQNSMLAMHLNESAFHGDELKTFSTQLEELFRDYQIVGGMPEVVQSWIETKSIETIDKIQSRILSGYENKFTKYAPITMFQKLCAIWNAVPAQLAKENRKFVFSQVKKSWRAKDLEDALYHLIRTGLIYKVDHVDKPEIPLPSHANHTHFKLYMCDVGLLRRTARIPASVVIDKTSNFKEIKGALIENIVCSELKRLYGDDVYYWSAEKPGRAEVEFIFQDGSDIIPVVAKAGSASRTRSLTQYSVRFFPKKTVLTSMDNNKADILPLYAFWNLKQWLLKQ